MTEENKKETFELKLTHDETTDLVSRLTSFYDGLDTIEDYFLERKKEKVLGIDPEKYTKEFMVHLKMNLNY